MHGQVEVILNMGMITSFGAGRRMCPGVSYSHLERKNDKVIRQSIWCFFFFFFFIFIELKSEEQELMAKEDELQNREQQQ